MTEFFQTFEPVEWFTSQFQDPTAASLFRLVLISWAAAAVAYIGLDRMGAVLLGRSRPVAQVPPVRARGWRWGRSVPPANYSMLPPGTIQTTPNVAMGANLDRPTAVAAGMLAQTIRVPDPAGPLDDEEFWQLFDEESAPLFGFENGMRLRLGEAPQRYNPVTREVESLERHREQGVLLWGWSPSVTTVVEGK